VLLLGKPVLLCVFLSNSTQIPSLEALTIGICMPNSENSLLTKHFNWERKGNFW